MEDATCIRSFITLHLFLLMLSGCYGHEGEDIIDVDNSMKFGQKLDEEVVQRSRKKIFNISEYRLLSNKLSDGRPYGVYDGLLKAKSQLLLRSYLTYNTDGWLFNNYDAEDQNKQRAHDNTPWINEKDPVEFSKSRLCKRLIRAVKDISKDGGSYYPYRVFGKIIRRGDHTLVSADSDVKGEFTALVFINEFWRKNYYGELYLYDENREIIGGATHKAGRVVIYESTILRLNRPPAIQFLQGQILFQVQFSKVKEKMVEGYEKVMTYQKEREEAKSKWFLADYKLPNGDPLAPPAPEKHKTFEFTTKTDGRKIFVYDGLFSKELLDNLRNFVLKYGTYFYDDSIDKTSDNVQWIAGFSLDPYIKSPYWEIVKSVAAHATGSSKMFPYDVSINLVRSSDHTRIHSDVGYYGEEEFTCLVYLNQNWTKENYGETTFFEKNSDDTEIVAQVRPRYGRTVIFDGNIPHSARPPSFNFSGARLTFVTKLHKNEYTGRKKNLQEDHRHFSGIVSSQEMMEIFSGRNGEAYAKKILEASIARKKDMYTNSVTEDEDEEAGEDEEMVNQRNKDVSDTEDGGQYGQPTDEMKDFVADDVGETAEPQEQPFFSEEEELDEYSKKLFSQLEGVTGRSSDAIPKIVSVYKEMKQVQQSLLKEYGDAIINVM